MRAEDLLAKRNLHNNPVTARITGRPDGSAQPYLAERHKDERFGDYPWRANVLQSPP